MPIDNRVFGIWRVFRYGGQPFIVENYTEEVRQEIQAQPFIIGTAYPRVMNISGAVAELKITAPLLVWDNSYRTTANQIHDGLDLIQTFGSSAVLNGNYTSDPFFIFQKMRFEVSAEKGATYTITALGDYNAIKSENPASIYDFGLSLRGEVLSPASYPLPAGYVYRVASFYDLIPSIGGVVFGPSTGIYLKELTIEVDYKTEDFTYVGQEDQRKIIGIAGYEIVVSGTLISDTRSPLAYSTDPTKMIMPLQAPAGLTRGGRAFPTNGTFDVTLRNSALSIIPTNNLSAQRFVFNNSSLQTSSGLLTTRFEGRLWAQTNV
jgi:hypothetical protein